MNLLKFLTKRNTAVFFLVLMCVQYLPIEGYKVSLVKVGAMCLAPLLWFAMSPKLSKAFVWGGLYFVAILFSGLFNLESFRVSTVGYLLMFIAMFILYYNLVYHERVFTLDFFIKLLKNLILAYAICLVIQQAFIIVGIRYFPPINLLQYLDRGIGANSLVQEPSVTARMLTVAFLSLLRMYEVKWGKENVNIKAIYADAKWVVLGFLWSMLTMGSGTAFVCLAVLSLYFIKRQYALTVVPLLVILYFSIPYINFEPLQRARVTLEATLTMDADVVRQADGSASARVVPLLNTLTELDLLDSDTWLGHGVDAGNSRMTMATVGGIAEYGLLSYILALTLIFTCIIHRFFSLETLLAFALVGLTINNFAYVWGFYMILSTARYFMSSSIYSNDQ